MINKTSLEIAMCILPQPCSYCKVITCVKSNKWVMAISDEECLKDET